MEGFWFASAEAFACWRCANNPGLGVAGFGVWIGVIIYITRIKVSSHLATRSCGGRGVLRSAFCVAWLADELIPWNKILLL